MQSSWGMAHAPTSENTNRVTNVSEIPNEKTVTKICKDDMICLLGTDPMTVVKKSGDFPCRNSRLVKPKVELWEEEASKPVGEAKFVPTRLNHGQCCHSELGWNCKS